MGLAVDCGALCKFFRTECVATERKSPYPRGSPAQIFFNFLSCWSYFNEFLSQISNHSTAGSARVGNPVHLGFAPLQESTAVEVKRIKLRSTSTQL